jgi:hypothetical protein
MAGKLWSLDGNHPHQAQRGANQGAPRDNTTAIAIPRGTALWVGAATGYRSLSPKGELARIEGLGATIGSPAIAISDSVAIAAWADHASADEPWRLRWVRFKAGEAPGETKDFTPPGSTGGAQAGAQAMSPALSPVPEGRFLLVWTEGPMSRHRVRALTLSSDGAPVGAPIEVSGDGVNAGQGQAAIAASDKGVVAYLAGTDAGFQVVARPIACSSTP